MFSHRLKRELEALHDSPPEGIRIVKADDDSSIMKEFSVEISSQTYKQSKLTVNIPDRYPLQPPSVRIQTRTFHPNIDAAGNICLDLLKTGPGGWKPAVGLCGLLLSVKMLLDNPNCDDPLNVEAARLYREDLRLYHQTALAYSGNQLDQKGIQEKENTLKTINRLSSNCNSKSRP